MGTTWLIRQKDSILRLDTSAVAIYTSHFLLYPSYHFYLKKKTKVSQDKEQMILHTPHFKIGVCVYVCVLISGHI